MTVAVRMKKDVNNSQRRLVRITESKCSGQLLRKIKKSDSMHSGIINRLSVSNFGSMSLLHIISKNLNIICEFIEKDVNRTDRTMDFFKGDDSKGTEILRNLLMTYMMYNFNLGYVQGMSDLLAPILMEIQDEILSFWLFVKFMERIVSV